MTQQNRETLLALADNWNGAGIEAARMAASAAPYYHAARSDLAHAANCFAVAAALRATASSLEVAK